MATSRNIAVRLDPGPPPWPDIVAATRTFGRRTAGTLHPHPKSQEHQLGTKAGGSKTVDPRGNIVSRHHPRTRRKRRLRAHPVVR